MKPTKRLNRKESSIRVSNKRLKTNDDCANTPNATADGMAKGGSHYDLNLLSKEELVDTVVQLRENVEHLTDNVGQLKARIEQLRKIVTMKYEYPGNNFLLLPDEIILKIFSMIPILDLKQLSQTCRHWNILATDHCLWYHSKVNLKRRTLKQGAVGFILSRGISGLDISFSKLRGPVVLGIQHLESFLIQSLVLSELKISKSDLISLLGRCRHLQDLDISGLKMTYGIGQTIGEKLQDLKTLNLERCSNVHIGLKLILEGCKMLVSLNLLYTQLFEVGCCDLIGELSSTINVLKMPYTHTLTDHKIQKLVQNCPNITELQLANHRSPSHITGKSLLAILGLKSLESLGLDGCTKILPEALACLQELPNLRNLSVIGIVSSGDDDHLYILKTKLPDLEIRVLPYNSVRLM